MSRFDTWLETRGSAPEEEDKVESRFDTWKNAKLEVQPTVTEVPLATDAELQSISSGQQPVVMEGIEQRISQETFERPQGLEPIEQIQRANRLALGIQEPERDVFGNPYNIPEDELMENTSFINRGLAALGLASAPDNQSALDIYNSTLNLDGYMDGEEFVFKTPTGSEVRMPANKEGISTQDMAQLYPYVTSSLLTGPLGGMATNYLQAGGRAAGYLNRAIQGSGGFVRYLTPSMISGMSQEEFRRQLHNQVGGDEKYDFFKSFMAGLGDTVAKGAFDITGKTLRAGKEVLKTLSPYSIPEKSLQEFQAIQGLLHTPEIAAAYNKDPKLMKEVIEAAMEGTGQAQELLKKSGGEIDLPPIFFAIDRRTDAALAYKVFGDGVESLSQRLKDVHPILYDNVAKSLRHYSKVGEAKFGKNLNKTTETLLKARKKSMQSVGREIKDVIKAADASGETVDTFNLLRSMGKFKSKDPATIDYNDKNIKKALDAFIPKSVVEKLSKLKDARSEIVEQRKQIMDRFNFLRSEDPDAVGVSAAQASKEFKDLRSRYESLGAEMEENSRQMRDSYQISVQSAHEKLRNLQQGLDADEGLKIAHTHLTSQLRKTLNRVDGMKDANKRYSAAMKEMRRLEGSPLGKISEERSMDMDVLIDDIFSSGPEAAREAINIIRTIDKPLADTIVGTKLSRELGFSNIMSKDLTSDELSKFTSNLGSIFSGTSKNRTHVILRDYIEQYPDRTNLMKALAGFGRSTKGIGKAGGGLSHFKDRLTKGQSDRSLLAEIATDPRSTIGSGAQQVGALGGIIRYINQNATEKEADMARKGFNAVLNASSGQLQAIQRSVTKMINEDEHPRAIFRALKYAAGLSSRNIKKATRAATAAQASGLIRGDENTRGSGGGGPEAFLRGLTP